MLHGISDTPQPLMVRQRADLQNESAHRAQAISGALFPNRRRARPPGPRRSPGRGSDRRSDRRASRRTDESSRGKPITCSPGPPSQKRSRRSGHGPPLVDHSFPRVAITRTAEPGRSLRPERSAGAIGKAVVRRMPPASSCMTTAQPGRTSCRPRPAGRLLAWHSSDAVTRDRVIAFMPLKARR
jgi:hypothetical protein